ncbi:MAG: hypothetical protein V2A67_00435 [Bacteroidota bacterium]
MVSKIQGGKLADEADKPELLSQIERINLGGRDECHRLEHTAGKYPSCTENRRIFLKNR